MEWAHSADDNLGPPGDPRRRFTLPMDLVFGKVCALLSKLSGRALLPPPTKTTSSETNSNSTGSAKKPAEAAAAAGEGAGASVGASASAGADDGSKSVIRDTLQESLFRHKQLAFRLVLSCLAPILSGGASLPPMTEEEIIAAEKKCRMEEGGADMLGRPPESFREAVLPEHLRYKAQFEYKVGEKGQIFCIVCHFSCVFLQMCGKIKYIVCAVSIAVISSRKLAVVSPPFRPPSFHACQWHFITFLSLVYAFPPPPARPPKILFLMPPYFFHLHFIRPA